MCHEACKGVLTFLELIYLFILINLKAIGKLFGIFSLWEVVGGPEKDRVLCWWWGGGLHVLSPRILLASWISLGIMVTRLEWMAQRLLSSNKSHQISLTGFLQCSNGRSLESVGMLLPKQFLYNFSHQSLETGPSNEQLRGLLIPSNFPKGHCPGSVSSSRGIYWCWSTSTSLFPRLLLIFDACG